MFEQTVAGSRTRTCLGASPDIHQVSPDHDNLLHYSYCYQQHCSTFGTTFGAFVLNSNLNICSRMRVEVVFIS